MGFEDLTERERMVARAARTGASARAIGEQLFLSPRTVETHLSTIYRKLGVATRGELIALLHDLHALRHAPEAPAARRAALPGVLSPADPFVGRNEELAVLDAAVASAQQGQRAAVMIAGEPGVGKSALVGRAAAGAHAHGLQVLAGRCDPGFAAPFAPVADALRPYLARLGDRAAAAGPTAGSLAAILPEFASRLPAPLPVEDAATARRLLVDAIRHVLATAAAHGGAFLAIEDVHWADRATLALLAHLVSAPELAGLVLVATFRNTDVTHPHALRGMLAGLWREPSLQRFELDGLNAAETARLAELTTGRAMREPAAERLRVRTGGNPFFILQLLRGLRPARGGSLPGSVADVVLDRVERLGPDAVRVVETASVLGREFDAAVLCEALTVSGGQDPAPVSDALDRLAAARLLVELPGKGRYRFAHDLVRESLHGNLEPGARASLHRAAGHALLRLRGDEDDEQLAALAAHFSEAASLGEGARAGEYCLAAARQAIGRMAPEDALTVLRRGLDHLPPERSFDPVRLELLLVELDAHAARMDFAAHRDATLRAADVARALGDPLALARTVDRARVPPEMGSLDRELLAVRDEAIAALGEEPSPLRTRLLSSASYQRTIGTDGWAALDQARRAVADGRRLGDADSLGSALFALAAASRGIPDLDAQLTVAEELTALGQDDPDAPPERDGRRFRGVLKLAAGDRGAFERDLNGLLELHRESGSAYVASTVAIWTALLALLDGDLPRAEEAAAGVETVSGKHPNFRLAHFVEVTEIRVLQDRAAETADAALALLRDNPRLAVVRALAARVFVEGGDVDRARELLVPLVSDGLVHVPMDWLRPAALGYLALAARACLGPDECRAIAAELAPYAGQLIVGGPGALVLGAADHFRGVLLAAAGDVTEARRLLAAALDLEESVGGRALAARTRTELAALLARGTSRDSARAGRLLDAATTEARGLGLTRELRRATVVRSSRPAPQR